MGAVGLEGDTAAVIGPRGCLAVVFLVSKPSFSDCPGVKGQMEWRSHLC